MNRVVDVEVRGIRSDVSEGALWSGVSQRDTTAFDCAALEQVVLWDESFTGYSFKAPSRIHKTKSQS